MFGDWSSWTYIASQILMVIGFAFLGVTYFSKKRGNQLLNVIACNASFTIAYILLNAHIAAALSVIGIVRDSTSLALNKYRPRKDKNTPLDYGLLSLWIILPTVAIAFTYQDWYSMLPYLGTILFVVSIWQKNGFVYRLLGIPHLVLFAIYQFLIANFVGTVLQTAVLITAIVGLIKYIRDGKKVNHNV